MNPFLLTEVEFKNVLFCVGWNPGVHGVQVEQDVRGAQGQTQGAEEAGRQGPGQDRQIYYQYPPQKLLTLNN